MSDLLSGFPQWIIPTFIIKGIMASLMEGFAAGIASAPGLLIKSVVNIIAFYIIAIVLDKTRKIEKKFN